MRCAVCDESILRDATGFTIESVDCYGCGNEVHEDCAEAILITPATLETAPEYESVCLDCREGD